MGDSMSTIINATTTNGVVIQPDNSGSLVLQTNSGTTALTIDTSQRAAFVAGTAALPAITTTGDTNTGMWFPAADTIAFAEGGTESMRIDSSGNVGIGTASPRAILHTVKTSAGAATVGAFLQNSDNTTSTEIRLAFAANTNSLSDNRYGWIGYVNGGGTNSGSLTFATTPGGEAATERMRIDTSGNLTIGTTDTSVTSGTGIKLLPSNGASVATMGLVGNSSSGGQGSYHLYSTSLSQYQFYVLYNGTIAARSGSITVLSDQSEKTNVRDLETGLNEVLALKPRRFDWIKNQGTNIVGFIAQEVQTILPDLIEPYKISDEETKLGLKMGDMLPTLVNAIQEQQTIINDLKARVTALEAK
jgi:hypothetical protein